jgi:transcriptional regulator with XRE-family HTH domain
MPRRNIRPLPPRRTSGHRAENRSLWVNEPLQLAIRDELDRRDWTISDLGRAIGSQPSLISRWMQGQRPNTESLERIAEALSLDVRHLMVLAGHLPPKKGEGDFSETLTPIILTLQQVESRHHLSDERQQMLRNLLDWMLDNAPDRPARHSPSEGKPSPPRLEAAG